MKYQFSALPDSRVEEGFEVLQLVAQAIRAKGRRQRISATSFETYQQWQAAGANYMVTDDGRIVGLLTLCRETLRSWTSFVEPSPVCMLRALATHPDHSGNGIGTFAVRRALLLVDSEESVYLDCVSEFLPDYYARLGFEQIARQDWHDPDGRVWDITLMCSRRREH